jgi:hypothetical protein
MAIPGGFDEQNFPKLGKQDQVLEYVLNLSPTLLNARAGQAALQLISAGATQRIRIISASGVADAAVAPVAGGLTLTFNVGGVPKAVVNLTAALALAAPIVFSTAPNGTAGANGGALTLTVTGGSITSTVPLGLRIALSVENV